MLNPPHGLIVSVLTELKPTYADKDNIASMAECVNAVGLVLKVEGMDERTALGVAQMVYHWNMPVRRVGSFLLCGACGVVGHCRASHGPRRSAGHIALPASSVCVFHDALCLRVQENSCIPSSALSSSGELLPVKKECYVS